jgi:hypothetical protein
MRGQAIAELVVTIAEGEAELDAGLATLWSLGIPAHDVEAEFLNRS